MMIGNLCMTYEAYMGLGYYVVFDELTLARITLRDCQQKKATMV